MKGPVIAAAAMTGGMAAGYLICAALFRREQRAARARRTGKKETPKKVGVMDKVLVLEAVVLLTYTVAALAVFWHTGAEPSTLTGCVFGVCGLENGVMGWIKTTKERNRERKWARQDARDTARDAGDTYGETEN